MPDTKIIATVLALSLATTGMALARPPASTSGFDANAQAIGGELAARAGHRVNALRQCNKQVDKFKDYTWGEEQSDRYRACMAEHGQPE